MNLTHTLDQDDDGRLRLTLTNDGPEPLPVGPVKFRLDLPEPVPMPGMEEFGATYSGHRLQMNAEGPDPGAAPLEPGQSRAYTLPLRVMGTVRRWALEYSPERLGIEADERPLVSGADVAAALASRPSPDA
jgi:hypothetical protein